MIVFERALWALTFLRMLVGFVFILHGSQHVLGLFGGPGLANFAGWLKTLQVPEPLAYAGALFELLGGLMLFLGIFVELGSLFVIPVMAAAIYLVHWKHGFFIQNGGFEYALVLLLCAAIIFIGGPGKFALATLPPFFKP